MILLFFNIILIHWFKRVFNLFNLLHKQVTILICPLDWGLGHASRTIPIIELLLSKKVNLIIAGSGNSMELLKKEYPSLTFVLFTDYSISYPSNKRMGLYMLLKTPSILYKIFREHQKLKSIIIIYVFNLLCQKMCLYQN